MDNTSGIGTKNKTGQVVTDPRVTKQGVFEFLERPLQTLRDVHRVLAPGGRIALIEPDTVITWMHELASDPRWRVREAVAIALQTLGKEDMPRLLAVMKAWARETPYVQRAVVAGLCEPAILKRNEDVVAVLAILDGITRSVSLSAVNDRRDDGFEALRKALGYGWSVAAAAAPQNAAPYLEKWIRSTDKDVAWIMRSNLGKARMAPLGERLFAKAPPKPRTRKRASA